MASGSIKKVVSKDGKTIKYRIRWDEEVGDGKRRKQKQETLPISYKDAEKFLRQKEGTIDTGTYVAKKITFADLTALFLKQKKPDVKRRSNEYYEGHAKQIVDYFGNTLVDRLRPRHIKNYKQFKIDEGRIGTRSVGKQLGTISQILDVGVMEDYLKRNVAKGVKRPKNKKTKIVILTGEEMGILLEATTGQMHMIIQVCLYTAMRAAEVCGLKWDCVDLVEGVITVDKTYADGVWGPPKTDEERPIQIGSHLIDLLAKWKDAAPETEDGTVFSNREGKPLDWRNFLNRHYRPLVKSLGLPPATPHSFRHTYVSALIAAGLEPTFVQSQAGHANLKMTMDTYAHPLNGRDPKGGEKSEAAIGNYLGS